MILVKVEDNEMNIFLTNHIDEFGSLLDDLQLLGLCKGVNGETEEDENDSVENDFYTYIILHKLIYDEFPFFSFFANIFIRISIIYTSYIFSIEIWHL